MNDEYDLQRFVRAQDPVYQDAVGSLRRGTMCTPHMEFMFPRLASKRSDAAPEPYAIGSLDEADAYLSFPLLGGRYRECVGILQRLSAASARVVFGEGDAKKLHASLTLFPKRAVTSFCSRPCSTSGSTVWSTRTP
jgi:uncharacterized protein (DUF1810 family)